MTEMFDNPTDAYIGQFQSFKFPATADTPPNSVIILGGLVGVTREPFLSGMPGIAFMGRSYGVYSLPKDAQTVLARGAVAYFDTATKKIVAAEDEGVIRLGIVWRDGAADETAVQVALD